MITHEKKKTVQSSRSKIIAITHRVKKSHRQINHLDKFSQSNWFSNRTLKFSGKFLNFFDKPSGRGRFFFHFEWKKEVRRLLILAAWVVVWWGLNSWVAECRLLQIDSSRTRACCSCIQSRSKRWEARSVGSAASLKTANGGGMWQFFFGFLKFAFCGIRMATFNQSLNLFWGRTKPWNPHPLNKKRF